MIRIIGKIPKKVTIACSGGVDSMVVVDFLKKGKRDISLAYFNHDTVHGKEAEHFVSTFAEKNQLPLLVGKVTSTKGRRSMEEFWRDERYKFFNKINSDYIITCHHLEDCLETWIMSACHGKTKLIPYQRGEKVYRPFLMTNKTTIDDYAKRNNVQWVEDPSNASSTYVRNHVRHNVIPQLSKVNPGIRTTIRKKLIELYKDI